MTIILAIAPGPKLSTWIAYDPTQMLDHDPQRRRPIVGIGRDWHNEAVRDKLLGIERWPEDGDARQVLCEDIYERGMRARAGVVSTVRWIGRFEEICAMKDLPFHRVARHAVKIHLCGTDRAKRKDTRIVMLDRFGPGKVKAIGLLQSPGPLYDIAGHAWSALEIAVTWCDLHPYP